MISYKRDTTSVSRCCIRCFMDGSAFHKDDVEHGVSGVRQTKALAEDPGAFARADDFPTLRCKGVELLFSFSGPDLQNGVLHHGFLLCFIQKIIA